MKEVSGVTFANGQTLRISPTTVGLMVTEVIVPWDEVADLARYISQTPRRNRVELNNRKRVTGSRSPAVNGDAMLVVKGNPPKFVRGMEKQALVYIQKLYREYEAIPRSVLQAMLSKGIKCTPVQARNLVSNLIHRQKYLGAK